MLHQPSPLFLLFSDMKTFGLLLAAASMATAKDVLSHDVLSAFVDFQKKFNKTYEESNYLDRAAIFASNIEKANEMNRNHILIGGEAVFGITKFSDLTEEEFRAQYLSGYVPPNPDKERTVLKPRAPLAATIDWRTKGVVTPVKDQGQCGSCWAFSATAAIESYGALNGNYSLKTLSVQQINSCDKVDDGCNGGNTETAYKYVQKAGGIESNLNYPYTSGGGNTGVCKFKPAQVVEKIHGYVSVAKGEDNLKVAVNTGPASICVAALSFQLYFGGILKECPGFIDHCVQVVGYDDTNSPPYWIVRNSWGTSWGDKGYIKIESGKDLCRIANDATYPTF